MTIRACLAIALLLPGFAPAAPPASAPLAPDLNGRTAGAVAEPGGGPFGAGLLGKGRAAAAAALPAAPGPGRPDSREPALPWGLPLPNERDEMAVLGHWPNGNSYAVYPQGDLLLAGCGASLVALDASDPAKLTPLGRLEVPGVVVRVLVAGEGDDRVAFAYCLPYGIVAVDLSDPAAMRALSLFRTGDRARELVRRGSLLYCAVAKDGLLILDVSDPARPREVGRLPSERSLFDLVLDGDFAYLADGGDGLVTVDVSDPAHPVEVDRNPSSFEGALTTGVALVGDHLVTCELTGPVLAWSLADPSAPTPVSLLDLGTRLETMEAEGGRVFLGGTGLFEVDASDPGALVLVGRTPDNIYSYSLEPRGDRLSLVRYSGPYGAIQVELMDVSTPGRMVTLGTFDDGGLLEDAVRSGDWIFTLGHHDGMRVLDASDPAAPVTAAALFVRNPYDGLLIGDVLWVGTLFGLGGIDVSDPLHPAAIGQLASNRMERIAARGDTIVAVGLVAGGGEDLRVIDVSQPQTPVRLGGVALPGGSTDFALKGHYALASGLPYTTGGQLLAVDISDPTAPFLRTTVPLPATGRAVALADTLLYVACADTTLRVYDVTDPALPALRRVVPVDLDVRGMAVVDGRLHLLSTFGITVMSLADPLAPREEARFQTGTTVKRIDVSGSMLTAASYESGVWILRDLSTEGPVPDRLVVRAVPNPFDLETSIELVARHAGRHTVRLYDLRGRLVRDLFSGDLDPGPFALPWSGTDTSGRPCASGAYLIRVEGPAGTAGGAVTMVR